MFATCLLNEIALGSDYSLHPVAEAFAGLYDGNPGYVGHHVVHGALHRFDSVMVRALISLSTTLHTS